MNCEFNESARNYVKKADEKIRISAEKILAGKKLCDGKIFFVSHFLGIPQRIFAKIGLKYLCSKLKIDSSICTKCGNCVNLCPRKNIEINQEIIAKDKCTACYRCINNCPEKAISLFSKKKPKKQYKFVV
jgi:ferredoxin